MSEELKPCPFCGNKALTRTAKHLVSEEEMEQFIIECECCFAEMGSILFMSNNKSRERNRNELIQMWDRRNNTTDK